MDVLVAFLYNPLETLIYLALGVVVVITVNGTIFGGIYLVCKGFQKVKEFVTLKLKF